MSLTTKVADLATRIGTEFKTVRGEIVTAQGAAEDYADSLAPNYDAAGAAAAAETAAKSYADGLAVNYDPAGAAASAETAAKSYADSLASNYDPAGAAATAETNAKAYADALDTDDVAEGTSNLYFTAARAQAALSGLYDPAGSASTAETNAKAYADTKIGDLVDGAPGLLDTLNELAAALGDDPSFASTISTALGLRVRVDAAQVFSSAQQEVGRSNIGAASAADLGDVAAANFVTTFEAALV